MSYNGRDKRVPDHIWAAAQGLIRQGRTPTEVSNLPCMPSMQAIHKRATDEGWFERPQSNLPVGKDSHENRAYAIEMLRGGATYTLVAASLGISRDTLHDWRVKDPRFRQQCTQAEAEHCMSRIGNVRNSKDPKDAKWLLAHHRLTREDFREQRDPGQGITINVSFDRQAVVIDGEAKSLE